MASTYTTRLRLEKQGTGENDSTWGVRLNTGFDLIDDSISGMATIATTGGATTLTANNASSDQARCAIIKATGALISGASFVIPAQTKIYQVWNATTGAYALTVGVSGGVAVTVAQGTKALVMCDGTDCFIVSTGSNQPFVGMINGTIVTSRSGNAETIAIKTLAGADPTPSDPVIFVFRNATAGTGDYVFLPAVAALSITISSGSTMGATNSILFRLWLTVFNDASTLRLGVINCLTTVAGAGSGRDVTAIYPLKDDALLSATSEGGAGAADNAQTIYANAAVTTKAMRVLGYLEYTLATVGAWGTAPSKVQHFGPGVPLPGQTVQVVRTDTGAVATGTTTVPIDDTIPQSTEGDQYMSQAITPSSAANVLQVDSYAVISNGTSVNQLMALSLYRDATANALKTAPQTGPANTFMVGIPLAHRCLAEAAAATTFKVRAGQGGAGTTTFNGSATSRFFGGVMNSYLQVAEVMA